MALPLYEQFAQVIEHMVTHDGDGGHGYTWDDRWGDGTWETITLSDGSKVKIQNGDRDCSSGVISALQAIGVDTHGASYTGDMKECLLKTGLFEWFPMSVPHYAQRGDIYLNEAKHTSVCKSSDPDMLMQFSINENGGVHGGKKGDQTGNESNIRAFRDYPYDGRLCWKDRKAITIEAGMWVKDSKGWWWKRVDGSWPKSQWLKINGDWYYFNDKGYALDGKWLKYKERWYWLKKSSCKMAHDEFLKIEGIWYGFDYDGRMYDADHPAKFDKNGHAVFK